MYLLPAKPKHIELNQKDQRLLDRTYLIIADHLSEVSFGIEELRISHNSTG
jgi:hypothetical protein